jgi:hypothetical protein
MSDETIFETTIQKRNPAERPAFLGAACGGTAEVGRRDEALARTHQQSRGLPDSSANGAGSNTPATDAPQSLEHALEPAGRPSPERLRGVPWPDLWRQDLVTCELLAARPKG